MKNFAKLIFIGAALFAVAGCTTWNSGPTGCRAKILGRHSVNPGANQTVYFSFDKSKVKHRYDSLLLAQARYLGRHTSAHVKLTGNADVRGRQGYNRHLGYHRARNVKKYLVHHGVHASQITVASDGEDNPAHNKHRCNRRVELMYTSH